MNDEYPLVSAILLAGLTPLNDILAAIDCFKTQTYPYKELIIVNNAPNQFDASGLLIQAEPNIAIIDTPDHYFAGMARNYGIASANGQIIAQFDADYWHAPKRLESQIATLASNEANVVVLTETLQYSFVNGRAGFYKNDRQAIFGTMVYVRPKDIDYPNVNKQEELGILTKFQNAGAKIVAMPATELMCKLYLTKQHRVMHPVNDGLSNEQFDIISAFLGSRH